MIWVKLKGVHLIRLMMNAFLKKPLCDPNRLSSFDFFFGFLYNCEKKVGKSIKIFDDFHSLQLKPLNHRCQKPRNGYFHLERSRKL